MIDPTYYRELVRKKYAGKEKITVLEDAALEALPERSLDYILLCSVIQYLERTGAAIAVSVRPEAA